MREVDIKREHEERENCWHALSLVRDRLRVGVWNSPSGGSALRTYA